MLLLLTGLHCLAVASSLLCLGCPCRAQVEEGAMVAAGAVVAPGTVVKSGEIWGGEPVTAGLSGWVGACMAREPWLGALLF